MCEYVIVVKIDEKQDLIANVKQMVKGRTCIH
jgi:hypothetical protein